MECMTDTDFSEVLILSLNQVLQWGNNEGNIKSYDQNKSVSVRETLMLSGVPECVDMRIY